jgi:hypothetical protein
MCDNQCENNIDIRIDNSKGFFKFIWNNYNPVIQWLDGQIKVSIKTIAYMIFVGRK